MKETAQRIDGGSGRQGRVSVTGLGQSASVVIGTDPWVTPALLLAAGLLAMLLASLRHRLVEGAGRRLLVLHATAALMALVSAGVIAMERGNLFWGATWDAGEGRLTLERPLPLTDVELEGARITDVLEMTTRSRTWRGHRSSVRFEVLMEDGSTYYSAPHFTRAAAARTRVLLVTASSGRHHRFWQPAALSGLP